VTGQRLRLSWALLLAGACALVYANALTGGFTYDDKAIVRDNPRIRVPERVGEIVATQYFGGARGTGTAYRPVLLLSYAVQWWIHGGDPVPFHAVNLLFHAAATLLLARLLLRLGLAPPIAIGAALLFAVHPVHVEAVTSIVGRGETLAAVLVLGSLLLGLRASDAAGRRTRRLALVAALVLYFAANLTKESAVVAPLLLFLCLVWTGSEGRLGARMKSALVRGLPFFVGAALALGAVFAIRAAVLGGPLKSPSTGIFELENPLAPLPPLQRALNASLVFLRMLGRLALPLRLSSDESAWSIRPAALGDPAGWLAAALLLALVFAAVWRPSPLPRSVPALGFLLLSAAALPTSNLLFPTGTILAERLAYLPSAGFCMIAAAWIVGPAPAFDALGKRRLAILAAVAVLFGARTVMRNPVWASDEALFTNMLAVSPESAKAHYDFAYMSAETGRPERAREHYTRATEIFPGYWDAWAGRGRMERELGDAAASEAAYLEALRIHPGYENGYFGLGLAREAAGNQAGAETAYREGLARTPRSLPLAYRLALALSARHAPAAGHAWHRALAIEPRSLASLVGYATWLADTGRAEEARQELSRALALSSRFAPALELERRLSESASPARAEGP
jgi:tetratricopeptide (TPR) repeat protein